MQTKHEKEIRLLTQIRQLESDLRPAIKAGRKKEAKKLIGKVSSLRKQLTRLLASKGKKSARPVIKKIAGGLSGSGTLLTIANMDALSHKIGYAKQNFKQLGEGSNRIAFAYKNYVVKFAKNKFGIASNRFEYQFYKTNSHYPLAKVHAVAQDFSFLLMEQLKPATPVSFKKALGYSWQQFYQWLDYNYLVLKGKLSFLTLDKEIVDLLDQSEFAQKILTIALKTDLARGDLGRVTSYGFDGRGKLKLLDYGSTTKMLLDRKAGQYTD